MSTISSAIKWLKSASKEEIEAAYRRLKTPLPCPNCEFLRHKVAHLEKALAKLKEKYESR